MALLNLEQLHEDFGVRITGVDLATPLSAGLLDEVRQAIDTYSLLHFPYQQLNDERHLALTAQLGEPEENHLARGEEGKVSYFGTIGNVQPDGSVQGNDHRRTRFLSGNNMWHTDSSFRPVPALLSINCAYETPAEGGRTEFVSARAAYRRLSAQEKNRLEGLVVIHDYVYSRSKVAPDAVSESLAKSLPPVRQKLIRMNPNNGAKNFYIGSHAKVIEGWNENDSRALIDDLLAQATRPQDIYSHQWQPQDVVIWDNRCLLHRGTGYDADKYRRYMRQTRVSGTGTTFDEHNQSQRQSL
ncbi:MAG: TauD/TfdA dioxygenase family protein [Gammaproteobacteria bacterium]